MYCGKCGKEVKNNDVYCYNCGILLKDENKKDPQIDPKKFNVASIMDSEERYKSIYKDSRNMDNKFANDQNEDNCNKDNCNRDNLDDENRDNQFENPSENNQISSKRKIFENKINIFLLVNVVIVIAFVTFIYVGRNYYSYENVAERYFKATNNCNWEYVYDQLQLPEGEFLTKDLFMKVNEETTKNEVSSYSINNATSVSTAFGQNKHNDDTRAIHINYKLKGEDNDKNQTIQLAKQDNKELLFFDKYKIASSDDVVLNSFLIKVCNDATVFLDGIQLTDHYLKEQGNASKTYSINYVFRGNHNVKITQDNMEDSEATVKVLYNAYNYTFVNPVIRADIMSHLQDNSPMLMDRFYEAIINNKDFSTLSDLFIDDSSMLSFENSVYNNVKGYLLNINPYGTLKKMSWSDINGFTTQSTNNTGVVQVRVMLTGTYNAEFLNPSNNVTTKKSASDKCIFTYRYKNNAWLLYDFSIVSKMS